MATDCPIRKVERYHIRLVIGENVTKLDLRLPILTDL